MNNQNLPPIKVYVINSFLGVEGTLTEGFLMSVRARSNQALQFTILLTTGALFTGLPAHAIKFAPIHSTTSLQVSQMWDCISDSIEVFTIESLRYMSCEVKAQDAFYNGKYLFSIDFVGEGYSREPTHWKTMHAIHSDCGSLLLYPQYRVRFTDSALCTEVDKPLPAYNANTVQWIVGS